MSAMRSMTGFASVRKQVAAGELTISLRGVNHRSLDLHFQHAPEFAAFENEMRTLLKEAIGRGHIEIRIAVSRVKTAAAGSFNREALAEYLRLYRQAAGELGLESAPDLNVLVTLPGVLNTAQEAEPAAPVAEAELSDLLRAAIEEFNAAREREGNALRRAIESEAAAVAEQTASIAAARAEALPRFEQRLRDKLKELLGTTSISEARLAEEAAYLADRSDIQEELTRLTVHTEELGRILDTGGEAGKRLDFLLQEMNREVNTTLAKSANAGEPGLRITNAGLAVKASIERIREQALNLE